MSVVPFPDQMQARRAAAEVAAKELLGTLVVWGTGSQLGLDAVAALKNLEPDCFTDTTTRHIAEAVLAVLDRGEEPETGALLTELASRTGDMPALELAQIMEHQTVSPFRAAHILLQHLNEERQVAISRRVTLALTAGDRDAAETAMDELRLLQQQAFRPDPIQVADFTEWRSDAAKPIPWLIHNWLVRGTVTVLAAGGGTGKSMLALGIGLQVALGTELFRGMAAPDRRDSVLLLDLENDPLATKKRIAAYAEHFGLGDYLDESLAERFHMINTRGRFIEPMENRRDYTETKFYRDLLEYVRRHQPGLIIIDHLRRISGSAEGNDTTLMGFVIELCDRLALAGNSAVLVLGHTKKGTADRGFSDENLRGASSIKDEARCVWEFRREGETLTLMRVKANLASSMQDPLAFRMIPVADSVCLDVTDVPASMQRGAHPNDIMKTVVNWFIQNPDELITLGAIKTQQGIPASNLLRYVQGYWANVRAEAVHEAAKLAIQQGHLRIEAKRGPNRHYVQSIVATSDAVFPEASPTTPTPAPTYLNDDSWGDPLYQEPNDDVPF